MARFLRKIALLGIIASFAIAGSSLAAVGDKADKFGLDTAADYAQVKGLEISKKSNPLDVAANYIAIVLSFLAVAFFLLTLYAGFKWMTAMGETERANKAKGLLEAAIIGLIIVLAAYGISTYMFKSFEKFTSTSGSTSATQVDCTDQKNNHKPCGVSGSQSSCYLGQCMTDCEGKMKEAKTTAKCKNQCDVGDTKTTVVACPTGQVCCMQ